MENQHSENPESPSTNARLKKFLRKAVAIIAAEKGLNTNSKIKLQSLADFMELPPEQLAGALDQLQQNWDETKNLTHYERAFVKFLNEQFSQLSSGVVSPKMEKVAIDLAKRKYEINGTRAEQLIQFQAEAAGVSRISSYEAEQYAKHAIVERIGVLTKLNGELRQQLCKTGKNWGLSDRAVEQIISQQVAKNKAIQNPAWKKVVRVLLLTAALLLIALGFANMADLIPDYWITRFLATKPIVQPDKLPPKDIDESRFSPTTLEILESMQAADQRMRQTIEDILSNDESQQRLGYQSLVRQVVNDKHSRPAKATDLLCKAYFDDPVESSALEIGQTACQSLAANSSELFSVRDLKNSYEANRFLGRLFFSRPITDQNSADQTAIDRRVQALEDCIQTSLSVSLTDAPDFATYIAQSESVIAIDQWNQLLQLIWLSPDQVSVLLEAIVDLTKSRLEPETLNQFRYDALIAILELKSSNWRSMERSIREAIKNCHDVQILDWVSVFEKTKDQGFRDLLGELLLPRIGVELKPRTRADIANLVEGFGRQRRNQIFSPVVERNEILEQRFLKAIEIEHEDASLNLTPDRIAQLALLVNVELEFCNAIENATHIDDSSFREFDRLTTLPTPRLRELVALPIDRRGGKAIAVSSATASDRRRMKTSLDRIGDLSPDSSGVRILALNQLERVAHRFERVSYREASLLADLFLANLNIQEQLNIQKVAGSFSHWPNLLLAFADKLPESQLGFELVLANARRLLGQDIEIENNGNWKRNLQFKLNTAATNAIESQIARDPENDKSNWMRLKIYLLEVYRQRLVIGSKVRSDNEAYVEPHQAISHLVESLAKKQATRSSSWDAKQAVELIRKSSANEIEKTAFANQLLYKIYFDQIMRSFPAEKARLFSEHQRTLGQKAIAGSQLYETELALLKLVDLKRQLLVRNLLDDEAQK